MKWVQTAAAMFAAAILLAGAHTSASGAASSISTASNSSGGVTVKVTHRDPDPRGELRFEIALDTKSVNLDDYDLKSSILLRAGGKTYEPTRVENSGGGRHREMVVAFPEISTAGNGMELIVRNVA